MKRVLGLTKGGAKVWVKVADVSVYSFVRKGDYSYLDIFYQFAQFLIPKSPSRGDHFLYILHHLDNKVNQIRFVVGLMKRYGSKLTTPAASMEKKILTCSLEYKFLAALESYLDHIHSLYDILTAVDGILGADLRMSHFDQLDWFKAEMDIRTLCHHIESPLMQIIQGKVVLQFKGIDKMRRSRYFTQSLTGATNIRPFEVEAVIDKIGSEIITSLNLWAKEHLLRIVGDPSSPSITGFYKDGRHKVKKIFFRDLMAKINSSKPRSSAAVG